MEFPENGLFWHWFTIICPAALAQQWPDLRGHNHPNYPAAKKWWWPPVSVICEGVLPELRSTPGDASQEHTRTWWKVTVMTLHPSILAISAPKGLLVSLHLPTGAVHSDWRRCRHDFLCLITICSPAQVPNSKLFIVWSRPSAPNTDQRPAHHDDWPEIETYRASDGPLSHAIPSKISEK